MATTEGRAEGSGETGCSELSITCELGLYAIVKEARVGLTGLRKCGIELPLTRKFAFILDGIRFKKIERGFPVDASRCRPYLSLFQGRFAASADLRCDLLTSCRECKLDVGKPLEDRFRRRRD